MEERKTSSIVSGLSAGIIVYVLAGGEFTGQGNLIAGAVKFSNPDIVVLSVVVLFLYWLLRHWIQQKPIWQSFTSEVAKKMVFAGVIDKEVKELIRGDFDQIYPTMWSEGIAGINLSNSELTLGHKDDGTKDDYVPIIVDGLTAKYDYAIVHDYEYVYREKKEIPKKLFWPAFIRVAFDFDLFFERLMSWILATVAVICIIYGFLIG